MINLHHYISVFKRAAFLGGCLFVLGCENSQRSIEEWTKKKVLVEEATNIQTLVSQGGRLKAKLVSPYMIRYTSDTIYVEFPKTLNVVFFDSLGRPDSHLSSLYGKYYENLNKVYLRDSVLVYNAVGDTLRSPELWWDQTRGLFFTDKEVRIQKNHNRIFGGKGLEAKQDLSDIVIKAPTGTVAMPDSMAAQ